jgi:hypothetical protein
MEKQYIIAHIEIPIEVTQNQNYNILNEHTSIRFEPCNELPPISEETNGEVWEQISALFDEKSETTQVPDESINVPFINQLLKKKITKKREHTTFKLRPSSSSNGTRKLYTNETNLSQFNEIDNNT